MGAIMEYVGDECTRFIDNGWKLDNLFRRGMVKIRHEFGFDEPHPRHGRVPTEKSLPYAMHVLEEVILPIHCAFFMHHILKHPLMLFARMIPKTLFNSYYTMWRK